MAEPGVLRAVLGDYPHTAAVKSGELTDPAVTLRFDQVKPVHRAFAPMVRAEAYDLSELAIVTALQAIAYQRPVVLLPAVVAARFQRGCLVAPAAGPPPSPERLAGRRIGVRAYTQTTGMWVRAHLAEDYGLVPSRVRWLTRDGAHVEQFRDPDYVQRSIGDRALTDLLRQGEIDAAIFGNDLPDGDEFVPVIPDAARRDREWSRRNGFVPINHMVAAGASACRRDPDAVRAAYALLRRAAQSVPAQSVPVSDAAQSVAAQSVPVSDGTPSPALFGVERLRRPVQVVIDTCLEQGLLPRGLDADEVFAPARELLGSLAD